MATPSPTPRSDLTLSRWIGLGLLLICLITHAAIGDGLGSPWRRLWFDTLQQIAPRERPAEPPAVVIAIDEASISAMGQWPWPRNFHAVLFEQLKAAGVRAIGVDILFSEPDRFSPLQLAKWIEAADPATARSLRALGDTDRVFADAIRRGNVVVPIAGLDDLGTASHNDINLTPAVSFEGLKLSDLSLTRYPAGLRAIPVLQMEAQGQAAIAFDGLPDGIVRRVPAVQVIASEPALFLGAETLRVANQSFLSTVRSGQMGMDVDLDGISFPVERDGSFWIHFGKAEQSGRYYIPAVQVMNETVDRKELEGKIALVAVTGLGAVDTQTTPLAEEVWGIEAHLQMIEQILSQDFLRRPLELFIAETVLLGGLGILLIQIVPRAPPLTAIGIGSMVILVLIGGSYIAFRLGWLFDASAPVLGVALTGAGLLGSSLVERDRERRAQERANELLLEAAAAMQRSVLPPDTFEHSGKVRLAAHLTPSFDVGGDLFDHFMLDDHRIFFLVGDVSGKGIAACQFMGISKRLWKIVAQREDSLDGIQAVANTEITQDNSESMFVTGIAAILDLETGEFNYSSAGHDQPILLSKDRPVHQLQDFTGLPAGLVGGTSYPVGTNRLRPGDQLVLFSDGVSEALNADRDAYGIDRLIGLLDGMPHNLSPRERIESILEDVRAFVGDAEQSDDLTLMVVERMA